MRGLRGLGLGATLLLPACLPVSGDAADEAEVPPGLASCLSSIGRADVAANPTAHMEVVEIERLVGCTADRARGR